MAAGTYAYADLEYAAQSVATDECLLLIATACVNARNGSKGSQGLKKTRNRQTRQSNQTSEKLVFLFFQAFLRHFVRYVLARVFSRFGP